MTETTKDRGHHRHPRRALWSTRRRLLSRRRRDQRGVLTPAVVVMAIGLLLLGGLVTDGGRQLNARSRAQATAEEAARAAADMLDLREAEAVIDKDKATDAVNRFCEVARQEDDSITACQVADIGHDDNTDADFVKVHVQITITPLLFGLIGVGDMHADVTASASPVQAVTDPGHDRNYETFDPSPSYPPSIVTLPDGTNAPQPTTVPVPTDYTTNVCGSPATLPLTIGVSCTVSTTTHEPPPPPRSTETTTSFTTFPTTVKPDF